jgi:hypothetical protein
VVPARKDGAKNLHQSKEGKETQGTGQIWPSKGMPDIAAAEGMYPELHAPAAERLSGNRRFAPQGDSGAPPRQSTIQSRQSRQRTAKKKAARRRLFSFDIVSWPKASL